MTATSAVENLPRPSSDHQAINVLHGAGAHFVLLDGKRPLWSGWQRRRAPLDVAQAHPGELGLIPASIGTSALDVDVGDPRELLAHHPAWAVLASRRPGGRHVYYRDDRPRGNQKWSRYGCTGELRSGKGYLVLWHDGAERLAEEVQTGPRDGRRFPADLFEAAGITLPTLHAPRPKGAAIVAPRAVVLPMLEVMRKGDGRNPALFDTVRYWAYAQDRGDEMERWTDRVREYALRHNDRFLELLPGDEVRRIAWNVASWTWSGRGPFDHSPRAQRFHQWLQVQSRRRENADRDRAILQDRIDDFSQREIAKRHGISRGAVRNVLDRDAPLFSADGRLHAVLRKPDARARTYPDTDKANSPPPGWVIA